MRGDRRRVRRAEGAVSGRAIKKVQSHQRHPFNIHDGSAERCALQKTKVTHNDEESLSVSSSRTRHSATSPLARSPCL